MKEIIYFKHLFLTLDQTNEEIFFIELDRLLKKYAEENYSYNFKIEEDEYLTK